ncbi:MAG TPA: DUF4214 domain-containing protein [Pirellulales bacterium]|nr:DUF4214 domain-containing protein [Pirellulales bacterium]
MEYLEERLALANDLAIVTGGAINTAAALIQAQSAGDFSFGNTGTYTIDPGAFIGAGAITLQANNDVTISNAINDSNSGDSLTIQAGRSIIDNANITYATALNLTANSQLAAVGAGTPGTAAFTMGAGTTIRSNANIDITLDSGIGLNATGNISIATLNAPAVTIADDGPTAGSSIVDPSGGGIISPTVTLSAINGTIGQDTKSLNLSTATVTAQAASGIFLLGGANLTLGDITNNSGEVDIAAVGALAVNGTITDSDSSNNGIVTLASDQSSSTPADITFGAGATIRAANQTYTAGVGTSGASGSAVVFTNGTFQGAGGASSNIQSFGFQQDASVSNSEPTLAHFTSGVLPVYYTIASLSGDVTILTYANVANTNLAITSVTGNVTFGSTSVSSDLNLDSLDISAASGTIFLDDSGSYAVATTGIVSGTTNGQIYAGAVSISQDTTLISNNGGGIDFASANAENVGNGNSLAAAATGAFTLAAGGFSQFQDITISGAAINLIGSVANNGTATFNGPVLVGAAVTIVNSATTFDGTIDSAPGSTQFDLTVDSGPSAPTMFEGNIGVNNPLNSLDVGAGRQLDAVFAGATVVNTIAFQNYSGNVTVDNDLVLNSATGSITFFDLLNSGATPANLTINAGTQVVFGQTLGSAVGNIHPFGQLIVTVPSPTISNPTSIELNGNVTTVGSQIYNGPVILSNSVDLNTAVGAIVNLTSTIDGAQAGAEALTIGNMNVAGEVIFGGDIGVTNSLAPLNVSATRIFINGTSVITDGSQTYSGDVFLGGTSPPITLNSGATGNLVTFNGDLTLGASATTATDTLDVTGVFTLSANSMLHSTLDGTSTYGNVSASSSNLADANLSLTFLVTPTVADTYTIATNVGGTTTFANVIADGATKFYVSAQDFTATNTTGLTLTAVNPTDAPLTVGSSGTYSTIQAAIDASVSGDVIEIDETNNDYAGFTTVNSSSQNVSLLFDFINGGGVTINSAVTLTADTAFELSGTALTFSGSSATIDGDVNLTCLASAAKNIDIQATVGGGTPLNSLTTGANITTQLAANITTNTNSGGQTYNGNVQLQTSLAGQLATLTAKTATFNGAVNDGIAGGGKDSLSVVGNAVFSGASTSLGGLTVSGGTFLNNGGIQTRTTNGASGAQTYSGPVILGSASTTLIVPGTLSLAATNGIIGNSDALTIAGTGTALTLNGSQIDDVGTLTVTDDTGLALSGDIATIGTSPAGTQSYSGTSVSLGGNTTLSAVSASGAFQTITFNTAVDTPADSLTINGNADFANNVTVQNLTVLGTTNFGTGGGTTTTTTAGQTYEGAVINTGGENDFADSGAGVVFGSSYTDDNNSLTITGNAVFNGNVTDFDSLTVTGIATIQNDAASITSNANAATGNITFDGSTTLANIDGGTLTIGTTVGAVALNAIDGGGISLTVNSGNGSSITLNGDICDIDNLFATISNPTTNPIVLNAASICASGTETFSDAVQLETTVDLMGSTVTFTGGITDQIAGTDSLFVDGNASFGASTDLSPANITITGATATTGTVAIGATRTEIFGSTLTLGGAFTANTGSGVTFGGPITGDGMELDVQNGAVFDGVVNDVGALNVFGTAAIDGGIVNSSGTQTYNGSVNLGQPADSLFTKTVLTATGAANSIVLGGVVGVGGTSTSLSAFADDNVSFGGAVNLAASGGELTAVADSTRLNAAGSGNGQIFISGIVNIFDGNAVLAGSAFNDTAAIDAGTGAIELTPSVTATVGVGTGTANFQVTNAQLAGLTAAQLTVGGVDATSVTVSGADATASGVTGTVYLISGSSNTSNTPAGEISFTPSASQFDATANSGLECFTNGNITVSANVSASKQITLTAGAAVTVSDGTAVDSNAGTVTFNVGAANAGSASLIEGTVSGTSVLVQGGSGNDILTLDYTYGASLPDGLTFNGGGGANTLTVTDVGGTVAHTYTISSSGVARDGAPLIALTSVQSALVTGGNGKDVFNVTPSASITFTLDGGGNGAAGDQLNYLASNLPVRVVPGAFTANFLQNVNFENFEKLDLNNAAGVNAIAGPETADRSTALTGLTAAEGFVQTLYLDDLGRVGSKAELDSWLPAFNSGGSAAVASGIHASEEARDHLVRSWYLTYLGRAANGSEEQIWVNLLATESEEQVLSALLGDSGHGFYDRAQTLVSSGTPDERYVEALYLMLLDRTPSLAEMQYWINVLPQIGLQGIAFAFLHSSEFRTDQFESYYNALLNRPSDTAGLNYLVTSGLNVAQVRVDVGASQEFFNDG